MSSCSVRVVVRFRPINSREQHEKTAGEFSLGYPDDNQSVKILRRGSVTDTFAFDRVFHGNDVSQEELYNYSARETILDVISGYNGTIFAYGQTGAGKSFSMFGPDVAGDPKFRGIIPRSCEHIFQYIHGSTGGDVEFTIKCSFLEIYKETIRDLLNPKGKNLKVRETPTKGVWVEELSERYVSSEQDVLDLIKLGEKSRAVSSTQMNAVSSRSHSLFILTLTQKFKDGSSKTGILNLADLAGSEKVGKTGATGDTLEEAKKINQSLSALGNCISALTTPVPKGTKPFIPYRDSKLTFVLKESLGGNTKTTLLCACSPHEFNIEETVSTLRFGSRVKSIKNAVKVNQQRSVAELERLLEKMKVELIALRQYANALEVEVKKWHAEGKGWDAHSIRPRGLTESLEKPLLFDEKRASAVAQALAGANYGSSPNPSPSPQTNNSSTPPQMRRDTPPMVHADNKTPGAAPDKDKKSRLSQLMGTRPRSRATSIVESEVPTEDTTPRVEDVNIAEVMANKSDDEEKVEYNPMAAAEAELELEKYKEEMGLKVTRLEEDVEARKENEKQLQEINEKNKIQIQEMEAELKKVSRELSDAKNRMEKEVFDKQAQGVEMQSVKKQLDRLKSERDRMKKGEEDSKSNNAKLVQEMDNIKSELSSAAATRQKEIETEEAQRAKLKEETSKQILQIQQTNNEARRSMEEQKGVIQKELDNVKTQVNQERDEKNKISVLLNSEKSKSETLEKQLADSTAEIGRQTERLKGDKERLENEAREKQKLQVEAEQTKTEMSNLRRGSVPDAAVSLSSK
eukprot:TRINITY_DN3010_c2_g1_i1.p1 TRINITY_DN3010_c2_g1~~TRINITY_DN3010_c2_g1_i1.p1  ORF type:complete len:801 (+),score=190.25 TRINITY_DN3010_c2_g1_i1:45-2447(+)